MPTKGPLPHVIQKLRGIASNKSVSDPDVYITCKGTVSVRQLFVCMKRSFADPN